jgi:hypothetical protein
MFRKRNVRGFFVGEDSGMARISVVKTMMFICGLVLCLSDSYASTWFATKVLDYRPGPDAEPYTDPLKALGEPAPLGSPSVPDNTSIVSLGGYGGYIILGFEMPVPDNPGNPGGWDFIVFGNAFYIGGNPMLHAQEPGYVEVGVDVNRNGLADDPFYLISGIPPPPFPVAQDYGGYVDHSGHFTQSYADVTPTLGISYGSALLPDDPLIPGITEGSRGGDAFDIAEAMNSGGQPANLGHIDFVKITTAVNGTWWPGGSAIATDVDAVSIVAPSGGNIAGLVTLQSTAAGNQSEQITFEIRTPGTTIIEVEAANDEDGAMPGSQVTTTADGAYTLERISPGTYDLAAKGSKWLKMSQPNVIVTGGNTATVDFTGSKGGDANDSNSVNIQDLNILKGSYGKSIGQAGYDTRADFNKSGSVNLLDLNILKSNYGQSGAQ